MANRDEKGLTLSGRVMLRLMFAIGANLMATRKLGEQTHWDQMVNDPKVLLEIRTLLWMASRMAERIGNFDEVLTYINSHESEDEQAILDGMKEDSRKIIESLLKAGGVPSCPKCNKTVCPVCRECHDCDESANKRPHDIFSGEGFGFGRKGSQAKN
jgi:hypothetical protein